MEPSEQNKNRAANIRTLWEALQSPRWDRNILIALGKDLYAKRALKDLDPEEFNQLLPRLVEIVEVLEARFKPTTPATPPAAPEEAPNSTEAVEPRPCPSGAPGQTAPAAHPANRRAKGSPAVVSEGPTPPLTQQPETRKTSVANESPTPGTEPGKE